MELLKHVAQHHNQEPNQEIKLQGEEKTQNEPGRKDIQKDKHTQKDSVKEKVMKDLDKKDTDNENIEKDKGVTLSESMLDDILLEGY